MLFSAVFSQFSMANTAGFIFIFYWESFPWLGTQIWRKTLGTDRGVTNLMMSFLKNCKSRPTLILCRHIGGCYWTLVHSGKSSSLSPNVSRGLKNYFWTFPDPILFAGPDICTFVHGYWSIKTWKQMDVSENSGTPKSSNLIGFSIINHPFWGTTIFGNTHISRGPSPLSFPMGCVFQPQRSGWC